MHKVVHSYQTDRKRKTKINNSSSNLIDLLIGVQQGSILGPLLFNICICDLFFFVGEDDVTSYADVVTALEDRNKGKVFNWFSFNYLKVNPSKSRLLLTSK